MRNEKWLPWPTSILSPRSSASRAMGCSLPCLSMKPPGWRVKGWARMSPGRISFTIVGQDVIGIDAVGAARPAAAQSWPKWM